MSLSRTRRKELKRLRSSAEDLWNNQQTVLEQANHVAREASRQLGNVTREEVVPRVRDGYEQYVRPAAHQARRTVENTAGGVLGSLLSIGDIAQDARVRRTVGRVAPKALPPQKKKRGFGTYLAIGAGVAAAAAVVYAVWQTFRADDELWVADDEPGSNPEG
ncbi:DNA helicase [Agromyces archimandritae]|uniref:DNA helicase n=1 Tax=Agromyces archimandritae TaxID=2781962 RepID=A0A975IPW6_9MICO|nr:DNA helicase [Agromyces archimandritae]QTX06037.1 DNA helicase [Agromyces archimandritae]